MEERYEVRSANVSLGIIHLKVLIGVMNGNLVLGNIEPGGGIRVASQDISKRLKRSSKMRYHKGQDKTRRLPFVTSKCFAHLVYLY